MPLIDESEFNNVKGLLGEKFPEFVEQLMDVADNLVAALDKGNYAENIIDLRLHSHSLKSVGRQTGLIEISDIARDMEQVAAGIINRDEPCHEDQWSAMHQNLVSKLDETKQAVANLMD